VAFEHDETAVRGHLRIESRTVPGQSVGADADEIDFGTAEPQAVAAVAQAAAQADRARIEKGTDGVPKLVIDESFDRAWRRVGLALDRSGFTVVDRDRSTGVYYVRYADPDTEIGKRDQSWLSKLAFWRKDEAEKPEQYRIAVVEQAPRSLVSVQDTKGAPDKTPASDRILALLRDQLK
jgi:outer membrane protein assembly factor BamC